jgi:UDP-N-acetylmuramyl pentapeptide synthase
VHSYLYFDTVIEAKAWLQAQQLKGYTLLIKGSRGIQMEQLIAP